MYLTWICNSWSILWEGGTKLFRQKLGHILSNFHRLSQKVILWKESTRGIPRMFYPLLRPFIFLLQALSWWRYRKSGLRKLCFLRVPVLQWNKQKLKSVIVHCEKSSTSQIGFCSLRVWTLNTRFSSRNRRNCDL